jgi:hypothetical protein
MPHTKHRASAVHTFMQQVCANYQVQLAGCRGSMSEMAYLTIFIACAVEENKTRKWKRNQRIRMKGWLKKRSDFSDNNLLRKINMSSPTENKFIYECSILLLVNYWNGYAYYSKRR